MGHSRALRRLVWPYSPHGQRRRPSQGWALSPPCLVVSPVLPSFHRRLGALRCGPGPGVTGTQTLAPGQAQGTHTQPWGHWNALEAQLCMAGSCGWVWGGDSEGTQDCTGRRASWGQCKCGGGMFQGWPVRQYRCTRAKKPVGGVGGLPGSPGP